MNIICFCGIDGSGKSTLIQELKTSRIAQNFSFKGFYNRKNVNLFQLTFPEVNLSSIDTYPHKIKKELVNAFYLDFLDFYYAEIEPLKNAPVTIISDRWFHCVSAFANCLSVGSKDIPNFLKQINAGNLIFYIKVPPDIAFQRQTISSNNYYKSLNLLKLYEIGYDQYFNSISSTIISMNNNDISSSIFEITKELQSII